MTVSIREVAQAAGVSPTTVSHVISGRRHVADSTRLKVRETMEHLGYSPMRAARNLALGRTQLIGLLVPDITNNFFAELTKGVESFATTNGYNIVLSNTGFDRRTSLNQLELLRSRAVDGVVYAAGSPFTDEDIVEALGSLPLVLVDEIIKGSDATLVTSDNTGGGALVAQHLLENGHRDVLVLHGLIGLGSSDGRVEGFTDAWLKGGANPPSLVDGGFTTAEGQAVFRAQLPSFYEGKWTSVFAVNDEMALGVLRECRQVGIEVPGELSIVGFDDTQAGEFTVPALTTVKQEPAALGKLACESLIKILQSAVPHEDKSPRVTLPVTLVERESVGRATATSTQ